MRRSQSKSTPASKPFELDQHLSRYVLAAAAAGVGILASSQPSDAEIVYTATHQQVTPNAVVNIDLNHDGIADFSLKDTFSTSFFSSFGQLTAIPVGQQNQLRGHTVSRQSYASALFGGAPIGPEGQFLHGPGMMAQVSFLGGVRGALASYSCTAPWANVTQRYLGLKFTIAGEAHFGWARLDVNCQVQGSTVTATLTGYAYETIANRGILAGKETGTDDSSQDDNSSLSATSPQPASLGYLAQGASGLAAWRRKQQ